jgi:hypothetical protein
LHANFERLRNSRETQDAEKRSSVCVHKGVKMPTNSFSVSMLMFDGVLELPFCNDGCEQRVKTLNCKRLKIHETHPCSICNKLTQNRLCCSKHCQLVHRARIGAKSPTHYHPWQNSDIQRRSAIISANKNKAKGTGIFNKSKRDEWNKTAGLARRGSHHSDATKQKIREKRAEHVQQMHVSGEKAWCNGKFEKDILDKLEKEYNTQIVHQYCVVGYFLDGYSKELNIAFEVDEARHFNKDGTYRQEDIIRQKRIEEYLYCKFIRIKV